MIDALIAGKVYGQPKTTTSKAGKPFATAKVRAAAGEGEALFVNVIAFDAGAVAALLALGDGDSVALAGSLTPKVWTDREGNTRPAVDLVAHQVLTAYHVTRKRKAVQKDDSDEPPPSRVKSGTKAGNPSGQPHRPPPEFDDDLSCLGTYSENPAVALGFCGRLLRPSYGLVSLFSTVALPRLAGVLLH